MEAPKKNPDNLNTVGIVVVGLAGALLVYVSFVGLQAYYLTGANALQAERDADGKSAELRSLQSEQESALKGYRWIDSGKQTVKVPIELAMQRVVETASADRGATLVPMVGAHDTPTVPAVAGRPPDGVQMPATPAAAAGEGETAAAEGEGEAAAAEGEAAATEGQGEAAAAEGQGEAAATPAAPAAAPAQPAPAAGGNPEGNGQQ